MTPADRNADDEALVEVLAHYDEALAGDTPALPAQSSTIGWKTELAAECDRAKACLELLDRVRRRWAPPGVVASDSLGETARVEPTKSQMVTIGRFRVERELGRGGLGIVHLAFDPKLGRQVALKVPRFDLLASDDLRRRFLREAEAAARLSHPNLVTVFEAGEDGAICFITSEYCVGPTLAQWLQATRAPVEPRIAALVVSRLALAVQHAHGRGVLHRDIKPSNILLDTNADSDLPWQPKLTDFGMAKLLENGADETRAGAIIGTPAYMAPEQAEGRVRDLDARTDVYALGAVLYEMLTHRAPAYGESDAESLKKVLCSDPITPRRLRGDIPRDLEAICLKCLARGPEQRYTTAQELANDLQRFLAGQPTEARPLSARGVALKWARRRPTAATVVAMTIVGTALLVIGGAMYTLKIRRHAEELRQALASRDEARDLAKSHSSAIARSYPSDVRMAQQAWKEGRIADAKTLLEKHRPRAGDEDRRNFAWYFLSRLCNFDSSTFKGHKGPVFACRYSPDGRLLATGGEDGELRLWTRSGKLDRSWRAHEKDVNSIAFSPDGKWLATTAEGQDAAIWDAANGTPVSQFNVEKGGSLAVAFTPDGKTLVAGGDRGEVSLVNTADWSLRAKLTGPPRPILLLAVSPDGAMLATSGGDNAVRLWNLADMQPIASLEGHTRDITAIDFSHDGTKIVSASRDGTVRLWATDTHRGLATFQAKMDYLYQVAFTLDDNRVLVTGQMGEALLWDLVTNKPERVLRSGVAPVYAGAIAPDDRQLATADGDGMIHLWDGSADPEKVKVVTGDPGREAALSADGSVAAIGDYEGNVRFYSLASHKLLRVFAAHNERVDSICFSPGGDVHAVGFEDGTIRLWNFPDMTPLRVLEGHTSRIWMVAISDDGRLLASCSNDRSVRIWETSSGKPVNVFPTFDDMPVKVAFSPDGRFLAAACRNGELRIWQIGNGEESSPLVGHEDSVSCVAWSPDGNLLASGAANGSLCLWDAKSFTLVRKIVVGKDRLESIAFAPDGRTFATGDFRGTIKLWDVMAQEEILQLDGHRGVVNQVFFTSRGESLYSFSPGQRCQLFLWPTR